jgi:DNA-binding MarR family transcriptional regulator
MSRDTLDDLFDTVSLGVPDNAIGFVLWRVVHRYQRELDRALVPLDLTHLQFMTLVMVAWLERQNGSVRQADLVRLGDIQPMQVSHMLKVLDGKGFVTRSRNAEDVRAKRVGITPAGTAVLRTALPVAIDVQRRLFGEDGGPGGSLLAALLRVDAAQR